MSYLSWDIMKDRLGEFQVDPVIGGPEKIRVPKKYFYKMDGVEIAKIKRLIKPRKIPYVWVPDEDPEYMVPIRVKGVDLDKRCITFTSKFQYEDKNGNLVSKSMESAISFSSIYKPISVNRDNIPIDVEREIRNPTPITQPTNTSHVLVV